MEHTTTEYLKYQFTDAELLVFAKQFALETQKKSAAEETQKEVVSQIKAEIAGHDKEIQRLSRYINQGYEYRNIECTVLFHDPAPKQKTIVRKDTGEVVKILAMDADELQDSLPFEEPAEEETKCSITVEGHEPVECTTGDIRRAADALKEINEAEAELVAKLGYFPKVSALSRIATERPELAGIIEIIKAARAEKKG